MPIRTALLTAGVVLAGTTTHAAVVRDLRAIAAASATRIIVEIDGAYSYRTHASPDGGTLFVDIAEASIDDDATRMLPVSDGRVDGVIVAHGDDGRSVRVAIDIAGKVPPRLDATADESHILLTFHDGGSAAGSSAGSSSPAASAGSPAASAPEEATGSTTSGLRLRRDSNPPESPGPASRDGDRAARAAAHARIAAMEARGNARNADDEGSAGSLDGPGESSPSAPPAKPPAPGRSVLEKAVVVLDPGHGGKDPGAKAWTGEFEKDIVLDLADRIARRLRASGQVEVVMTRSGDEYVALADRRDTSQRWNAAAFVSIHANASGSEKARGFETYYYSRSTGAGSEGAGRVARRLARVENGGKPAKGRAGSALARRASHSNASSPVLDRRSESMRLARLVQGELVRRLEMRYEAVRDLGAKEGPFFVLGENAAPSVLVEAAFLTHREEGVRMGSEVYREQIADGVARGILAFLEHEQRTGIL